MRTARLRAGEMFVNISIDYCYICTLCSFRDVLYVANYFREVKSETYNFCHSEVPALAATCMDESLSNIKNGAAKASHHAININLVEAENTSKVNQSRSDI